MSTGLHVTVTDSNDYQTILNGSATVYDFNYLLLMKDELATKPIETLGLVNDSLVQFFSDYHQFKYQMYDRILKRNEDEPVWEVFTPLSYESLYPRIVIVHNLKPDSPEVVAEELNELSMQ